MPADTAPTDERVQQANASTYGEVRGPALTGVAVAETDTGRTGELSRARLEQLTDRGVPEPTGRDGGETAA